MPTQPTTNEWRRYVDVYDMKNADNEFSFWLHLQKCLESTKAEKKWDDSKLIGGL